MSNYFAYTLVCPRCLNTPIIVLDSDGHFYTYCCNSCNYESTLTEKFVKIQDIITAIKEIRDYCTNGIVAGSPFAQDILDLIAVRVELCRDEFPESHIKKARGDD